MASGSTRQTMFVDVYIRADLVSEVDRSWIVWRSVHCRSTSESAGATDG